MNELEKQTKAQLIMIEKIYVLNITNKDEIASLIASEIDNERQVLTICSSLNSWILLNRKQGDVVIPRDVIKRLFKATSWQKKNA